jgi:branched-chain amino acid transport system substrate-binding protein
MAAALAMSSRRSRRPASGTPKTLISAMEGMEWETPEGQDDLPPEDHQALQSMYHFKIRVDEDVAWGIPDWSGS